MTDRHGAPGAGRHLDDEAHRHRRAAAGERNVGNGTIASISGTTFVLTTKEGDLTVVTGPDTNFHSPRRADEASTEPLAFADLRVGQHIAVQGECRDDTTLVAARVHVPKP